MSKLLNKNYNPEEIPNPPRIPMPDDNLELARNTAKEWFDKAQAINKAFASLQRCFIGTIFAEGFLSTGTTFKLHIHKDGDVSYKELDALIQILEVHRQTMQDIEWANPIVEELRHD